MVIRRKDGTVLTEAAPESGLDLSEQDLRGADFQGLHIEGGNFADSDLRSADFSGAELYGTYLYRADCSNCNFTGALLQGVVLDKVNLSGVSFLRARLIADNMGTPCSVLGADLRTTNLTGSVLTGCRYDSWTQFPVDFDPAAQGMVREK